MASNGALPPPTPLNGCNPRAAVAHAAAPAPTLPPQTYATPGGARYNVGTPYPTGYPPSYVTPGGGGGSMYGSGYGAPPGAYGGMGPYGGPAFDGAAAAANPHLAALQQLYHAVGSLSALTELLGMNADALQHVVSAAAGLLERLGQASGELVGFLRARPPLDPETGLPLVTGAQYAEDRTRKLVRWTLGATCVTVTVALLRALFWRRRRGVAPLNYGMGPYAAITGAPTGISYAGADSPVLPWRGVFRLAMFAAGIAAGGRLATALNAGKHGDRVAASDDEAVADAAAAGRPSGGGVHGTPA